MITHKIFYIDRAITMRWHIDLPFRLHKGDIINGSFLIGKPFIYGNANPDEWKRVCSDNSRFNIEYLEIANNMDIFVTLSIPF